MIATFDYNNDDQKLYLVLKPKTDDEKVIVGVLAGRKMFAWELPDSDSCTLTLETEDTV